MVNLIYSETESLVLLNHHRPQSYTSSARCASFDGNSGLSHGSGHGFPDEGPMVTGNFVGLWRRDGNKIEIKYLVDVDSDTQNLDLINIDMHAKTVLIRSHILETVTLSA